MERHANWYASSMKSVMVTMAGESIHSASLSKLCTVTISTWRRLVRDYIRRDGWDDPFPWSASSISCWYQGCRELVYSLCACGPEALAIYYSNYDQANSPEVKCARVRCIRTTVQIRMAEWIGVITFIKVHGYLPEHFDYWTRTHGHDVVRS